VTGNDILLTLVVITALGFDFTNGFHDTGNAMATSIATGALPPRIAVAISGVLNLVGAFLSFSVAATIASGLVETKLVTPTVVFAGLCGGILWNLFTWFFGIPSSSSHALIGGVVGSTIAAAGGHGVQWHGLVSKVIIPAVMSPVIAGCVAAIGTYLVYRITRNVIEGVRNRGFRIGQIGSASMVSLAHGTNDAQKTMGIITLALIANGSLTSGSKAPAWVIVSCALAISLGTYIGGWRVIRALGKGLVEIESPQGMAAESSSAAVILLSSYFGYSLSTTHVATGSILGTGVGKAGAEVRWNVAGRMATAWVFTLPMAGIVGALAYYAAHGIGGTGGVAVIFVVLVAAATVFYLRSRQTKVDANNVNAEWTGGIGVAPEERATAGASA
jgi:PiT family inorganic phosphate transporter